jgi:DNA repair protein RecO (recombination protein O)
MGMVKSDGIILKVIEYSETSNIVTVWTREFGKLSLIAKGARRPKSPFESALDLLAFCRLVFLQKPNQSMGILTEAKLERRFRNRRGRLEWLYAGYYVAELLKSFIEEGEPNPWLFDLTDQTLRDLDQPVRRASGADLSVREEVTELNRYLMRFESGLLTTLGHFPMLTHCVGCGRKRETDAAVGFAISAGGIVCPQCRNRQSQVIDLTDQEVQALLNLKEMIDQSVQDGVEQIVPTDRTSSGHSVAEADRLNEPGVEYPLSAGGVDLSDYRQCQSIRRLLNDYLNQMAGRELRMNPFLKQLLLSNNSLRV